MRKICKVKVRNSCEFGFFPNGKCLKSDQNTYEVPLEEGWTFLKIFILIMGKSNAVQL